jgi:hypothetical protein
VCCVCVVSLSAGEKETVTTPDGHGHG